MIYGARVEQAREFRCFTQAELAAQIGVNQAAIARVESGSLALSDTKVKELAHALRFPVRFFERDIPEFFALGSLEFRADASTPAKEKKRAYQYASLVFEFASALAARLKMPPMRLPRLAGDPEEAATVLRSELAISPNMPIRNLTSVLERAGVYVFSLPGLRAGCHGFSVWAAVERKLVPAIFVSADAPGDRARHTLAHEVGELSLENMPAGRAREKHASRFAAAFLMPADALRRDLVPPVDLTEFLAVKQRYGVSVQSAIIRARRLELISGARYKVLFRQLGALGWRTHEPDEYAVPKEMPRALTKMIELLYGEGIDYVRLASDARLDPWLLRQIITTHASKSDLDQRRGSNPAGSVVSMHSRLLERNDDAVEA